MSKLDEAKEILKALDLPATQQNDISAYTFLALCGLEEDMAWGEATRGGKTVTKGIMDFVALHYGKPYAANTRETFRRQVLHYFVQGGVADLNPFIPDLPTNSPRTHYAVSEAALAVVRAFRTPQWETALNKFKSEKGSLQQDYQRLRDLHQVPVIFPNGQQYQLSPGSHNELEACIIQQFAPRFAPGAEVLYLGDTADKALHLDTVRLEALNIFVDDHTKLPDVILFDREQGWLYLVEAVTSHGPVSPKRAQELATILSDCTAEPIYVTAFPDRSGFRQHASDIAWETEVWIAEAPDHMIHFNGHRFLGPTRKQIADI